MANIPGITHERLSLPELIAQHLRKAIVNGDIAPGQPLRQEEIATQFATSRIPVREGLRQLEAEGLVAFHANRGAVVTALSPDDVREIFEIRLALETAALRFAIPMHTEETWRQAEALLDDMDRRDDANPLNDLNRQFHICLYEPSARPRLLQMITGLYQNGERYEQSARALTWYHSRAQEEHRQLLQACRIKDCDGAASLLERHIEAFGRELVRSLRKGGEAS